MEKLCARCGAKLSGCDGFSPEDQQVFIRVYYKDCLCPSCVQHVKDNFYAFDISSAYLKNK